MPGSDPQRPRHTNANRNEVGSFQPPDLRNLQTPAKAVDASGRHTAGRTVRSRRTRRRLDGDASSSRQYPRHLERAWDEGQQGRGHGRNRQERGAEPLRDPLASYKPDSTQSAGEPVSFPTPPADLRDLWPRFGWSLQHQLLQRQLQGRPPRTTVLLLPQLQPAHLVQLQPAQIGC